MTTKPQLEASDIVVRFGELRALDRVSLALARGQIIGLIGPNGSGKSTLINVFSGFVRPSEGQVIHHGRQVTRDAPDARARRGIVRTFQAVHLFGRLTVKANLEAAAVANGVRRRAARRVVDETLESLGLEEFAQLEARTLPYGAERRVAIGRAVATRPEYLLLDEPAAGLDESETDEIAAVLRQVRESTGCGMLVVEHDMRLIGEICDQAVVLSGGTELAAGRPAEVMRDARVVEAYLGTAGGIVDVDG